MDKEELLAELPRLLGVSIPVCYAGQADRQLMFLAGYMSTEEPWLLNSMSEFAAWVAERRKPGWECSNPLERAFLRGTEKWDGYLDLDQLQYDPGYSMPPNQSLGSSLTDTCEMMERFRTDLWSFHVAYVGLDPDDYPRRWKD